MNKKRYNARSIEAKWQKIWEEEKVFKAEVKAKKPKYYILDMFPYPSGAGLHVGHVTGYTGTDILARYMRQKGYNVLHPMGWDSFGLPAEQYAIRTGTHPALTTAKNIATYKRQLKSLGFSYDWDREMKTSDPDYYKWTQWIFTQLFEKDLAYEAMVHVNFCPKLGTVLANEEVQEGKSVEGGYPVEKRPLRQWVLKITAYAERLLEDLEELDWPESIKRLQRNWIGKSEGATVFFTEQQTKETLEVFTTRPDTLFGVTYLVLAPEHPLVEKITTPDQKDKVEAYRHQASQKSDLERQELTQEKTGVWTGSYTKNPLTGEEVPIWISDYVLQDYGTGAVMAVPGNDERDFAFAKAFQLKIVPTYDPDPKFFEGEDFGKFRKQVLEAKACWTKEGKVINSSSKEISLNGLSLTEAKAKILLFLEEKGWGRKSTQYKLRDWLFSRQRYWGEPIPILHFEDGSKRVLGIDELPLCPPEVVEYTPSETGESPLAKVEKWVQIKDPKTKKFAQRETNTMPQWAGSCWYYLRFLDPQNQQEAFSDLSEKYWMPVDLYVGGMEHAVLHLLYARFWHKVLFDLGIVHTKEPFKRYQNQGLVTSRSFRKKSGAYLPQEEVEEKEGGYYEKATGEALISQVEKMSKSKLNGVTPDEIIEEFGADSLRLYEMFMGPFDKEKVWSTDAVGGCKRFLNRFYDLVHSEKITQEKNPEGMKLAYQLAKTVRSEIENLQFNTAIAHMMEFINAFSSLTSYPKEALLLAVQVLYPFAPHLSEELWQVLGRKEYLAHHPLLPIEESFLQETKALYIIQVNGKLRAKIELDKGKEEKEVLFLAKQNPNVARFLESGVAKVVFVPDRLLNIVVK